MRVTANAFPNRLNYQLAELTSKQAALQKQAATGQRISKPSDNPLAMRKVLDLQGELRNLAQYQTNSARLKESLDASYGALKQMKSVSDRAGEIATLADSTKGAEGLKAYATEINQMLEHSVQVANSKHINGYLFGGTKNTAPPITATRDGAGKITSTTYQGTMTVPQFDVAEGISLSIQFPSENSTGTGNAGILKDSRYGSDFITHLIQLRDGLEAAAAGGDAGTAALANLKNTSVSSFEKDETAFIDTFSTIGAIQSRLDSASNVSRERAQALDPLISREADADLADTLVRLNEIQNAYMAALKSGSTIMNTSLLDYLR